MSPDFREVGDLGRRGRRRGHRSGCGGWRGRRPTWWVGASGVLGCGGGRDAAGQTLIEPVDTVEGGQPGVCCGPLGGPGPVLGRAY
jgi:hypothetical protein